jgi:uncharacterized protein YuzE
MGSQKMKSKFLDYDIENDVLYLYFEKAQDAVSREIGDGLFLRLDPNTDQVVGVTVLNLRKKIIPTNKTLVGTHA